MLGWKRKVRGKEIEALGEGKMIRRFNAVAAFFMLGSMMALSAGYAEIIEVKSKIMEISTSPASAFIKVSRMDPQTGKNEEIKVEVTDSTLFGEIESFENMKVGDEIVIEADYNAFTHDWKAQSIKPYKQM